MQVSWNTTNLPALQRFYRVKINYKHKYITNSLNDLGWLNSCNRKSDSFVKAPSTGSWVTRDTSGTIISRPANSPVSHPYQLLQYALYTMSSFIHLMLWRKQLLLKYSSKCQHHRYNTHKRLAFINRDVWFCKFYCKKSYHSDYFSIIITITENCH